MAHHRLVVVKIVTPSGERADIALARALEGVSRRHVKECFRRGDVFLRSKPIAASYLLRPGEAELELRNWAPMPESALPSPRGAFLPIVHEDERLLVLHKPSGVPSLPHSPEETDTAVGAALGRFPGLPARGLEPGLLHRLDTQTSGLLVFAKTADEWSRLRALWRSGAVRKFYRACVNGGEPPRVPALLQTPLGHDPKSAKRMIPAIAGRAIRGKPLPARTEILEARSIARGWDLLVRIETGVMHQIRCHLSSAGWPIVGDPIYGGEKAARLWLHAWKIELPLASGATLALEAEMPEDWPS